MQLADQKGKISIVTGANTGVGEVTARELGRLGARVYVACRSQEKAEAAIERMRAAVPNGDFVFLPLDLASFESVRNAASQFLATRDRLDILVNNAGLAGPRGLTADGFELTFGTNHLGHFLFTLLLADRLMESAPARIVHVSSGSHYSASGIDFEAQRQSTSSLSGFPEYCVSKLANVLFSQELDARLGARGVSTYAINPGQVGTDIWERRIPKIVANLMKKFMLTVDEGARTQLHCAAHPDATQSGLYWDKCKPNKASKQAFDKALQAELWRRSLEWTGAPDLQVESAR